VAKRRADLEPLGPAFWGLSGHNLPTRLGLKLPCWKLKAGSWSPQKQTIPKLQPNPKPRDFNLTPFGGILRPCALLTMANCWELVDGLFDGCALCRSQKRKPRIDDNAAHAIRLASK